MQCLTFALAFVVGGFPILPLPPVTSSSRSNHIFIPICRGRRSSSLANSSSPPYPPRHLHSHSSIALVRDRPIQRENSLSGQWNRPHVRFGRVIRVFASSRNPHFRIFSRNSCYPRFPAIRVDRFRVICISRFSKIKTPASSGMTHPSDRDEDRRTPPFVWTHGSRSPPWYP